MKNELCDDLISSIKWYLKDELIVWHKTNYSLVCVGHSNKTKCTFVSVGHSNKTKCTFLCVGHSNKTKVFTRSLLQDQVFISVCQQWVSKEWAWRARRKTAMTDQTVSPCGPTHRSMTLTLIRAPRPPAWWICWTERRNLQTLNSKPRTLLLVQLSSRDKPRSDESPAAWRKSGASA